MDLKLGELKKEIVITTKVKISLWDAIKIRIMGVKGYNEMVKRIEGRQKWKRK